MNKSVKVKSRSIQSQVKVKSRSIQSQVKVNSKSSQGQIKVKSRLIQSHQGDISFLLQFCQVKRSSDQIILSKLNFSDII